VPLPAEAQLGKHALEQGLLQQPELPFDEPVLPFADGQFGDGQFDTPDFGESAVARHP